MKFDFVLANPPYVRGNELDLQPTDLLGAKANLYLHVCEKAVETLKPDGELQLLVPVGFFSGSWGAKLRQHLAHTGSFTKVEWNLDPDWDAEVEVCRFTWVKGEQQSSVLFNGEERTLVCTDGHVFFTSFEPAATLGDFFEMKVGCATTERLRTKSFSDSVSVELFEGHSSLYVHPSKAQWSRFVELPEGNKIIVRGGPSRRTPRFKVASSRVIKDVGLMPKRAMNLQRAQEALENWPYWEELGVLLNGRWGFGVGRGMRMPIDLSLASSLSE